MSRNQFYNFESYTILCVFKVHALTLHTSFGRFNEFGNNGGPAAAELSPKVAVLRRNLSSKLGVAIPDIDVRPYIFHYLLASNFLCSLLIHHFSVDNMSRP